MNVFSNGSLMYGSVEVHGGKITGVEITSEKKEGKRLLLPGFIDIHLHGSCNFDFLDNKNAISRISKCLVMNGVTTFMPTLASAPMTTILVTLRNWMTESAEGADPCSIHLEGPFLSRGMKGAQNPEFMRPPSIEELKEYSRITGGGIGLVTLAPELPGAMEFIDYCGDHSIRTSIGHTAADFETALRSFERGVTIVNHTYNAMTGLHHRKPGVVGAALTEDAVYCELIADGIHVSPAAVRILTRMKPADKIILVTDGIKAQNSSDGEFHTEAFDFNVKDGVASLRDGTLAGSTLTMDRALGNIMLFAGIGLERAVPMVTANPASAIGLDDRGSIEEGKRADLVLLSPSLEVKETYVLGKEVYGTE